MSVLRNGIGISLFFLGTFAHAAVPIVNNNGVVNNAGFGTAIAPGDLISIFGSNLATITTGSGGLPLPTSLGGTTVTINGIVCPLLYVSSGQVNAQLPYEVQPGSANLVVKNSNGTSAASPLSVKTYAPGIFLTADGKTGVVQDANYKPVNPGNPVAPGGLIIVYGSGIGVLNPAVASGYPAGSSPPSKALGNVTATIGGVPAQVAFAGATGGLVGLTQFNIIVPPSAPSGLTNLVITEDGASSNAAQLSVAGNTLNGQTVTWNITNNLIYPVNFSVNGNVVMTVPAQGSKSASGAAPFNMVMSYDLVQPTLGGRTLGDPISGVFPTVANPSGAYAETISYNTIGGLPYFAPRITNKSGSDLLLGVNMGLQSQNECNCVAPAGSSNVVFGYYKFFGNSNVRAYVSGSGYTGAYSYFGNDPSNTSATFGTPQAATGLIDLEDDSAPGSGGGGSTASTTCGIKLTYSAYGANWVCILLTNAGWNGGGSPVLPTLSSSSAQRDELVEAAVLEAYGAEASARVGSNANARSDAVGMIQSLQSAYALCSDSSTFGGPALVTLKYFGCSVAPNPVPAN